MMITLDDYFGPWVGHRDATDEVVDAAERMLPRVNALLAEAEANGVKLPINPVTKSQVSGKTYGGFRPQDCPQGAPHSSHKEGRGVDVYDPHDDLDNWITDECLQRHGLYREHPDSTASWCHLTDKPPRSGKRTFLP